MERFWTLQYLAQQHITELTATLFKEAAGGQWLVRADELPLVLSVLGAQGMERGAKVRVKLGHIDAIALDVNGTVLERLDSPAAAQAGESADDEGDESELTAGPLTIAVDLNESPLEPVA
jgi:exoribonuclease-2